MINQYDAFDDDLLYQGREPLKPFWTIDYESNNQELLDWLKDSRDELVQRAQTRIFNMRVNMSAYRGAHFKQLDGRRGNTENEPRPTTLKNPRLFDNMLYDLTEAHVSSIGRFEPAVDVEAKDQDEWEDRVTAKVGNEAISDLKYRHKWKKLFRTGARYKRIMGQVFVMCTWNKDKGQLHPSYVKLMEKNKGKMPRIPVVDSDGNQIMSSQNEPLFHDKPVRVGDLDYWLCPASSMFMEIRSRYEDSNYAHYKELVYIDELKAEYPDLADKIVMNDGGTFDVGSNSNEPARGRVWKWTFIHKSTKDIANGRKICYIDDCILENGDNPYRHRSERVFPWARWTDIEIPEVMNAISTYENAKLMQKVINNMHSMIVRNQVLFSHPKWMTPKGAKIFRPSLGNDGSIVEYMGAIPPSLAQSNPTPPEIFQYLDKMETRISIAMEKHPISQGEPPQGITAGVALQFLEEQEAEREDEQLNKYFDMQVELAEKSLSFMSHFYRDDEERLEQVVGTVKSKKLFSNFTFKQFARPFTIKVLNSPALPRKKASRMQYILDMKERVPHLVSDKYFVDSLGLGNDKQFKNAMTQSFEEAMKENNDLIMFGQQVATEVEPKTFEDHLIHYEVHLQCLRDYGKDTAVPEENIEALKTHIEATEMLMADIATRNPMFAQKIMGQFDNFPIYYTMDVPLFQLANPQMPPEGQGPAPEPQGVVGQPMASMPPPAPTEMAASTMEQQM